MGTETDRHSVGTHFKNTAYCVTRAVSLVDDCLEADFRFGIDAAKEYFVLFAERLDLVPGGFVRHRLGAHSDNVAQNFDAEFGKVGLGKCAYCDTRGGFTGTGAFKNVACIIEVVLDATNEVGVSGTRPFYLFELLSGAFKIDDWHRFGPILPVLIGQNNGDGCANSFGVTNPRNNMGLVCFNLHASATAEALLAAPAIHG